MIGQFRILRQTSQKRRFPKVDRLSAPFAPRNTTSFIIRAKKFGGIASRVTICNDSGDPDDTNVVTID